MTADLHQRKKVLATHWCVNCTPEEGLQVGPVQAAPQALQLQEQLVLVCWRYVQLQFQHQVLNKVSEADMDGASAPAKWGICTAPAAPLQ
ncbi:MAG: hypothetical protein FRX49_04093 [Trebouxia sp. A1-2]|nr:MAG: hypothetical protein FRX49_04093 [Trebouxia sp. A1-2]